MMFEEAKDLNVEIRSDTLDWTPLHYAAFGGHVNTAKRLIQRGADVNSITHEGKFPLILAVSQGHRKMAVFLLQNDSDINMQDIRGYSVLHECLDIDTMTNSNWTPMQQYQMVELLLMTGADVKLRDAMGDNVLHFAVRNGAEERVVQLILCVSEGADHKKLVNMQNNAGQTILLLAHTVNMVELLLKHEAEINHRAKDGRCLLHLVVNKKDTVKYLLDHKADCDKQDLQGRCPLHLAVKSETPNFHVILMLLDSMVNINIVDVSGETALHLLMRKPLKHESCGSHNGSTFDNELAILSAILCKRPKLDIQNNKGLTALHVAMRNKRHDFAHMLLKAGASYTLEDNSGITSEAINMKWFRKYHRMEQFTPRETTKSVLSSRQVTFDVESLDKSIIIDEKPEIVPNEPSPLCELPQWVLESDTTESVSDESKTPAEDEEDSESRHVTFKLPETIDIIETKEEVREDTPEELKEEPVIKAKPKQVKQKKKIPVYGSSRKTASSFSLLGMFPSEPKRDAPPKAIAITRQISSLKEEMDDVKEFLEEFSKESVPTNEKKKTMELTRQITSLNKDMDDVKKMIEEFG